MATTTFKFKSGGENDETFDINLCTHRIELYLALTEIQNLIRRLYNGKDYSGKVVCLCPFETGKDEFGRNEVKVWKTYEDGDGDGDGDGDYYDKCVDYVEVDYIVNELQEAIGDALHILNE